MISGKDLIVSSCSLLFLLFVASSTVRGSDIACSQKLSPCSCSTADGKVIDLKPLSTGSAPRFTATGTDGFQYQWDPCREFQCNDAQVSVCQVDTSQTGYPSGIQSTAEFIKDGDSVALQYTYGQDIGARTSTVHLKCDPTIADPKFEAQGQSGTAALQYDMTLTAKEVCPIAGGGGGGLSLGDVLLIIFFVSLLLYVVIGVLFNIFYRHNSGMDVIPNRSFWMSLPFLVKDGAVFTFSKARGVVSKDHNYQEM